jgi:hypothetical protein
MWQCLTGVKAFDISIHLKNKAGVQDLPGELK